MDKRTKRFYCLWRKHGKSVTLMENEMTYAKKQAAFKRAKELEKDLVADMGDAIIVRKITVGSLMCDQWEFDGK